MNEKGGRGERYNSMELHGLLLALTFFLMSHFLQPTEQCPLTSQPAPAKARAMRSKRTSRRRSWSTGEAGWNGESLQMPIILNHVFKESSQCWFLSGIWCGSGSKSFHLGGMCSCCTESSQDFKTVPGFCVPIWVWWAGKAPAGQGSEYCVSHRANLSVFVHFCNFKNYIFVGEKKWP